jgi:hypothetical protein
MGAPRHVAIEFHDFAGARNYDLGRRAISPVGVAFRQRWPDRGLDK